MFQNPNCQEITPIQNRIVLKFVGYLRKFPISAIPKVPLNPGWLRRFPLMPKHRSADTKCSRIRIYGHSQCFVFRLKFLWLRRALCVGCSLRALLALSASLVVPRRITVYLDAVAGICPGGNAPYGFERCRSLFLVGASAALDMTLTVRLEFKNFVA